MSPDAQPVAKQKSDRAHPAGIRRDPDGARSPRGSWLWAVAVGACCFTPLLARAQPITAVDAALAMEQVVVEAIANAEKSVVAIACVRRAASDTASDSGGAPPAWDVPRPTSPDFIPNEFGTGVVIDRQGLIVTNAHVLGELQRSTYYVWVAGKSYPGQVKAVDPWMDLAVLQIEATNLQPVRFGSASNLRKGQIVIALGNPYAIARDGEVSASWGIIANLTRRATAGPSPSRSPRRETLHHFGTLIQTDARLNLGTSGGALINLRGEMVGLTTSLAALSGYEQSAGFAIPVDEPFKRAVETLKAGRVPEYGFLGVEPENLSDDELKAGKFGARVREVIHGTPALRAGVRRNDVITHINSVAIRDATHLILQLSGLPVEANVRLTIARPRRLDALTLDVVLSKKYVDSTRPAFGRVPPPQWRGMRVDYATAIPPLQFVQRAADIDLNGCVAITEVTPESPAWKAGLRPFSFISHVGQLRVVTPRQFHDTVDDLPGEVELHLTDAAPQQRVVVVSP